MPPLRQPLHLTVPKTRRTPQDRTELLIPSAANSAQEAALLSHLRASTPPPNVTDDGTVILVRAYLDVARIRVLERVRRERERNAQAMRRRRAEREAAKLRDGELGSVSKELSWGDEMARRGSMVGGWGGCGEG